MKITVCLLLTIFLAICLALPADDKPTLKRRIASLKKTTDTGNLNARSWYCQYFPWMCEGCKDNQFTCDNDKCIPWHWECDGINDCGDNSDENNCGCKNNQYTCNNGNCIRSNWECDNFDDCGDNSDEDHCGCQSNQFTCDNSNCIYDFWECDNYDDCGDNSDEQYCGCESNQFTCDNSNCIYDFWECDNYDDCGDNSDEQHCESKSSSSGDFLSSYSSACGDTDFICDSGLCITTELKCNNYNDCGDNSDEINCDCQVNEFTCINKDCIAANLECNGEQDCSDNSDEMNCGEECAWSDWSAWSHCNTQCNAGTRERSRFCSCTTGVCEGESDELEACPEMTCNPEAKQGCGARNPQERTQRIVGGEDAVVGSWPWQAQLYYGSSFSCGGTLIGRKYVISAAHCFDSDSASPWQVNLGKNTLGMNVNAGKGEHAAKVAKIIIHELYNDATTDNDIALMVLEEEVPDSPIINGACLDQTGSREFGGQSCFISGWGTTSFGGSVSQILQEASVPIIDRDTCNESYNGDITSNMLCAGFLHGGVDACQGDSGGPLVCTSPDADGLDHWYLVGITSWGNGCALANYPGVYTKVANYISWINEQINNNP
ncbi:suppressor of tumorigenicity 14 protein-like isoform X2 [Anneissia japonica]|uniref:suppressor of tumorigenicity 14 protein-like isoform X2 n=1 Tax=Anneissia japonica TaxID=1529436 RepID=UPI00142580B5|nr:suppressor of tumorigenicity 14 protein-like isoform X2 [Anneissia japonica]